MADNNYQGMYDYWRNNDLFDQETRTELDGIKDNPKEIEERFYQELAFGTAGIRGIMAAGTNRMNKYVIWKVSQGVADYISQSGEDSKQKGIVIAYDTRLNSKEFARYAAEVFAGNKIKVYLFNDVRPTPELSFAVRHLDAAGGVVITASHNPKQYNGYKVYGSDGGQLSVSNSAKVFELINKVEDIFKIDRMDLEQAIKEGLVVNISDKIDDEYISKLKEISFSKSIPIDIRESFKVVYTPLNGAGNKPVRRILSEIGFKNVLVVKEQENPDPEFTTLRVPNPEERDSFELAMELGKAEGADLIIGTDADGDRLGVITKNANDEYIILSGNEIGCLLTEYMLHQKKARDEIGKDGFVIKTVVTTELVRAIAAHYGVATEEVFTGFKYIAEKIKLLDEFGDKKFIFGFEESYGYLAGTFVRDKDAVIASMLVTEMAANYKSKNMSLYDGLQEIYKKYGYYLGETISFTIAGKEGQFTIQNAMKILREQKNNAFQMLEIVAVRDYLNGKRYDVSNGQITDIDVSDKSNVLYFEMPNSEWFCIRPSGTEPKLKVYHEVFEKDKALAQSRLDSLKYNVLGVVKQLLFGDEN